MIHDFEPNRSRIGWPMRTLLVIGGWVLVGGFVVAYRLEPDPRGFGTHQKFGWPPCTIRVLFGVPCPSCGMTTSFANSTKGRLVDAARANLTALVLALLSALMVPWCFLSAWLGHLCWITKPGATAAVLLGTICGLATVEWLIRLFILPSLSLVH